MNDIAEPYSLAPAGYLILQESNEARLTNEYRRTFGPYSGVDRLPPLLPSDSAIRQAIGESPVQDARFARAIDECMDSRFGNTAFIPDRRRASRLLKVFQGLGFRLELVFCQLAWKVGEEDRLNAYATTDETSPVVSQTYGFDVSWPTCNHSAILQPGIVSSTLSWHERLNQNGLLSDYHETARLREEYLAVYPYPPFDIYLVHKIEPE